MKILHLIPKQINLGMFFTFMGRVCYINLLSTRKVDMHHKCIFFPLLIKNYQQIINKYFGRYIISIDGVALHGKFHLCTYQVFEDIYHLWPKNAQWLLFKSKSTIYFFYLKKHHNHYFENISFKSYNNLQKYFCFWE